MARIYSLIKMKTVRVKYFLHHCLPSREGTFLATPINSPDTHFDAANLFPLHAGTRLWKCSATLWRSGQRVSICGWQLFSLSVDLKLADVKFKIFFTITVFFFFFCFRNAFYRNGKKIPPARKSKRGFT